MCKIDEFICDYFLREKGIKVDRNFVLVVDRKLGFDSLMFVKLIVEIEDEYGIELDDYLDELTNSYTLGDYIDVIKRVVNTQRN